MSNLHGGLMLTWFKKFGLVACKWDSWAVESHVECPHVHSFPTVGPTQSPCCGPDPCRLSVSCGAGLRLSVQLPEMIR